MYRIACYNPQRPVKATFYIQSKGLHSGRPLDNPIPNCFAVFTDAPFLKSLVYALYTAKKFDYFIIGSVVPFIRIKEVKDLIDKSLQVFTPDKQQLFKKVELADKMLQEAEKKLKLATQLKQAFAMEVLK